MKEIFTGVTFQKPATFKCDATCLDPGLSLVQFPLTSEGRAKVPHGRGGQKPFAELRLLQATQYLLGRVLDDDKGVVVEYGVIQVLLYHLKRMSNWVIETISVNCPGFRF